MSAYTPLNNLQANPDANLEGVILALKEVRCEIDGINCSGDFLYVPFTDGMPNFDRLCQFAMDRLIQWCVPPKVRNQMYKRHSVDLAASKIFGLALETLKKVNERVKKDSSSGELGELLTYLFIEGILNAPAVAYKMYLKANSQDQVKGTDAIHARYDAERDKVQIFIGESKLHKSLSGAVTDAINSIHSYHYVSEDGIIRKKRDFALISQNIDIFHDVPDQKAELDEELAIYFDLKSEDYKRKDRIEEVNAILIGFDCDIYGSVMGIMDVAEREKEFIKKFNDIAAELPKSLKSKIEETSELKYLRYYCFILPFRSIYDFQEACSNYYPGVRLSARGTGKDNDKC